MPSIPVRQPNARSVLVTSALIVEDEADIGELLRQHIALVAQHVSVVATCAGARRRIAEGPIELVILDLNLPDGDGLELCRALRARNPQPLIIVLTARTEEAARIRGFDEGADDYLCKPFSIRELMARIGARVRRADRQAEPRAPLVVRDLMLDPEARTGALRGRQLELSRREFDLLWYLASHADRVYSREQLLAAVWGPRFEGFDHTVNAHINRLRTKLDPERSGAAYLITVWGSGYRFVAHTGSTAS